MEQSLNRREFLKAAGGYLLGSLILPFSKSSQVNYQIKTRENYQRSEQPNVILIVMDTVRTQNMSLYGYDRTTTPNLQQFARDSMVFTRAFAPSSWTLPSHASMFTGHLPLELSVDWQVPLDETYPTLAQILSLNGYVTAGFSANNIYCNKGTGLARGFQYFSDHQLGFDELLLSSILSEKFVNHKYLRKIIHFYDSFERKNAEKVNHEFLNWLDRTDDRPFFAFLNYFDAHEPYAPPEPYNRRFGNPENRRTDLIKFWGHEGGIEKHNELSQQEIQAEMDAYDGCLAYLDQQLGSLLKVLSEKSLIDKTLIIITSDHGEQFGEHGLFSHGNSLYLPNIHVPLIIRSPMIGLPNAVIDTPVRLSDIPATVMRLLQIPDHPFPERTIDLFDNRSGSKEFIISELTNTDADNPNYEWKGARISIVDEKFHFILNGDESFELYEYQKDPSEDLNLANQTDFVIEVQARNEIAQDYLQKKIDFHP